MTVAPERLSAMRTLMQDSDRAIVGLETALHPGADPESILWMEDLIISRIKDIESNLREIREIMHTLAWETEEATA